MAANPRSPFTKNAAPGGAPRPSAQGGNSSSGLIAGAAILLAALIGVFYFLNQNKENKLNEIANAEAQNKKTQAENKARAEEHKRLAAKEKEEQQERRKALEAQRAAEAAAQQDQTTEPEEEPVATTDTPETPEEPADTTETEEDDTPTEETGAGETEGELVLSPEADKDPKNAKLLAAMVSQAKDDAEYRELANTLREKLAAAYPEDMKEEDGKLCTPIRRGKLGEKARCIYTSLSLALEKAESVSDADQSAFLKWLLTDKKGPAVAFAKSLAQFQITSRADAVDKMQELQQAYKDEPKKAFGKIKGITNPLDHNVSKKLYPHSKKDIDTTIAKLKNAKQKGTASAEQRDAVNLVNVYRYLCGLPADVVYDATYEKEANEAASACKAAGHIAHDLGHHTNQCNLFAGIAGPPVQTVSGYMADNGENNRKVRGHRAWILYPGTGKTAFGKDGSYQAMRTLDGSSKHRPKTAWSYPGRGFYPVDYLHGKGWSYYCAPGTAMPDSEDKVKVEMWSVPRMLKSAPSPSRLNKGSAIPILNTYVHIGSYMPTGNTIVFEPDYDKMKQNKGKLSGAYWIRISWPGYKDEYVVEFY